MSGDFLVRDTRHPGHFWADNEVLDVYGAELGAHAFAVYMVMARNATNGTGECRVSIRKIAAQLGMSSGGVFNALARLVELGLARMVEPGDRRFPAIYLLADVKAMSVHTVNTGVHPVNSSVHPVNSAFTTRTRNKERKTLTKTYKTKSQEGQNEQTTLPDFEIRRREQERESAITRAKARGFVIDPETGRCSRPV